MFGLIITTYQHNDLRFCFYISKIKYKKPKKLISTFSLRFNVHEKILHIIHVVHG